MLWEPPDYRQNMENNMEGNCVFCRIIAGEIPSVKIMENDEFLAVLDAFPASKGHALVLPKNHVANIFEIDSKQAGRLF